MTVWPRILRKPGALVGLLRRFAPPLRHRRSSRPTRAAKGGNINRWRGYLRRSDERLRRLDLSAIGAPEGEADPELCLVKAEVLRRAGHHFEAQRFLREAPRLSPTRRRASAVALRAAAQDFSFRRLVEEGDQSRDAREWGEAEDFYAEALRAYPEHYGYIVQYAHCLKEQGRHAEAECHYRSALALGAPRSDVDEHLAFVATQQGFPANFDTNWRGIPADGDALDAPPTKADVELVFSLLLGREALLAETLQLLRRHRSLRSLVMSVVKGDSFISANTHLLSTGEHRKPDRDPH